MAQFKGVELQFSPPPPPRPIGKPKPIKPESEVGTNNSAKVDKPKEQAPPPAEANNEAKEFKLFDEKPNKEEEAKDGQQPQPVYTILRRPKQAQEEMGTDV